MTIPDIENKLRVERKRASIHALPVHSWALTCAFLCTSLFPLLGHAGSGYAGSGYAGPEVSVVLPAASDPTPAAGTVPGAVAHVSAERNGVLTTTDGLTLRLTADLGSVRVVPLEAGAPPVVRYELHLETDASEPLAKRLLESYVLKSKSTSSGVEISGQLPSRATHGARASAQFWVHFEITVPAG